GVRAYSRPQSTEGERARPGDDRSDRDEGSGDEPRYALPVPIRVQADEVARRGIEEEVPLRKEHLVEEQEERIEGDRGDDPDDEDAGRRRERAVAYEAQRITADQRTLEPDREHDDRDGENHSRAVEN